MKFKPTSTISRVALLVILLAFCAFIPKEDDPLDKLVTALQKWTIDNPQEKLYLQMDKPYYALGDTIWFKGYITTGSRHQLSAISGSVYVDLITERDSIIKSLKLPATSGMVMGDFTLGDELKEGNYRIRAYTQWMRNAGEEYFFDKTFTVGSVFSNNIVTKADYKYKDVDGKQVLTATLNYTDDQGKPLANKSVLYRIVIDKNVVWTKNVKTDADGNVPVSISNEKKVDLAGAYIRTVVANSTGKDVVRDFPVKASLAQSDVQFFPESGNLVNGIASRVGFKAVGVDGLGINITGKVIDNENKEIADVATIHAGMGNFTLKPESGKNYTAKIKFDDGSTKDIALPKVSDDGYVLSVYQAVKDSVLVRISTSPKMLNQDINLVAHVNGEVTAASAIKITNAVTSVWVDKKTFPTGIAQFTIFSATGAPLAERVAFVRNDDLMQLSIKASKQTYNSKEPVFMALDAKDGHGKPTLANFSVSVIDETKVPVDENSESTILSNLLLTSDIKGYVEKPNYYFAKVNNEVNQALDNLMLTQGYRRFIWKDLTNTNAIKPKFEAEGLGVAISGNVTNLSHKILPGATVTLLSVKAHVTKFTTTDSLGRFKFDGIFMTDSIKFTVQARNAKNSDKVIVNLDTLPKLRLPKNPNAGDLNTDIRRSLKAYIDAGKKQDELYAKMGRMDMVHRLREVEIKAAKDKQNTYALQGAVKVPEGHASRTYMMKDPEKYANLMFALSGNIGAAYFVQNRPYAKNLPLAIVLNGRELTDESEISDIFDSGTIDPADVVRVDVLYDKNNALLNFYKHPEGMLLIYTKPNFQRKAGYNPSVVNINPKGFNNARDFYSPKYDRPGGVKLLPDVRSTVYWNPYVQTGLDGKTGFGFFNADGPGTYKVTVEGINADGQLGRLVYRYKVDGDLSAAAFTPKATYNDDNIKVVSNRLDTLAQKFALEKVYLHTDKPYYNIGDTLWFKSYVTDANQLPSKQSGLLYVELDDDSTEAVRRVTIQIKNGTGWGQIALPKTIFHEGGYTLRAYTNWMQNFGQNAFFSQRFYLGVPARTAWLVKSTATIKQVEDKNQLDVDIKLNRGDRSVIALRDVEVKIYEGKYYLLKEQMRTGVDGSLKFSKLLKDKVDGRNIRVQITSLEKADNGKVVQVPLSFNRPQKIDLQFLPEGGYLAAGLKSTVGFKAIGGDGKGTSVEGAIYDGKGLKVADFTSLHAGMGAFEFTPKAGETYSAKITQPAEVANNYKFPPVMSSYGKVLHIKNPEEDGNLTISIGGITKGGIDSAWYVIGTSGGKIYYSQKIDINQPELTVAKDLFPTGIVRFTLLNGKGALNNRLVFIDHKDQLSIKMRTNKQSFKARDSVGLEIEVTNKNGLPVQGNFSLAITDNTQVKPDTAGNNNIAISLLLNSGLKGYIENPGYYINRKDKEAWQALDNLMLTQGWTGWGWKELSGPLKEPEFIAEKDFKITGKVVNALNKPVPNSSVLISSQKPSFYKTILADAKGEFTFSKLPQIDSGSFFIQAQNANGKQMTFGQVTVNKFKPPLIPEMAVNSIMPWYVNSDTTQLNYVKRVADKANFDNIKGEGTLLRNVNIKTAKIIKNSQNPYGPGKSDLSFDEKDIKESGVMNLWQLLKQKLPGIVCTGYRGESIQGQEISIPTFKWGKYNISQRDSNSKSPAMVDMTIDGWPVNFNDDRGPIAGLSEIQIATLKGLEIIYSKKFTNSSIQGPQGTALIGYRDYEYAKVEITTGNGAGWYIGKKPGTVTYRPLPILYPTEFYSPKYKVNQPAVGEPDYRSTVYWEPNITTDATGKARMAFYTSDLPKDYTANLQGFTTDGQIGSAVIKLPANGIGGAASVDRAKMTGAVAVPASSGKGLDVKLIAAKLDTFSKKLPFEKVYLHTDKPYYNLGDTLWFKSYLMDARNLRSKKSGLLYVELDDDTSEVVRRITIPIKAGLGWGQIPLPHKIFHEGGYTLRAYTNWMQNFGSDVFFTQRFYLGVPAKTAWLVNSSAAINRVADKDQLEVDIKINRGDRKPIALSNVEVRLYDGTHYLLRDEMRTGIDGSLKFSKILKDKISGQNLRVQITSLEKADKSKVVQVPLTISRSQKIDLQFLPEGGNLVAGLTSIVGFKAIGEDGKGTNIAGVVYDSRGGKVSDFASLYKGMGSFSITPKPGEVYTAKITQPQTAIKTYTLPAINLSGTVMQVDNLAQDESITVNLSGMDKMTADSACHLIVSSGGDVYYSEAVDHKQTKVSISKSLFPTGIARITLLKNQKPLNQRIVFIDHNDQLNIKISTNKTAFQKRDSVGLEIEVKDAIGMPMQGNFSLTVTDNTQVKADTSNSYSIAANLLLNAELKGLVETPGYYLSHKNRQTRQALDNLMLTQGWTGYDWKDVFAPTVVPKFEAEKDFKITGTVVNLNEKPLPNSPVLISSQKPSFVLTDVTDANGRFSFNHLPQIDSGSFFLQAKNEKGKDLTFGALYVDRFKAPDIPPMAVSSILPWYVNADNEQVNFVTRVAQKENFVDPKSMGTLLRNVNIKKTKVFNGSVMQGRSDLAYDEQDIKESTVMNLYQLLKQKIPGFKIVRDYSYHHGKAVMKINDYFIDNDMFHLDHAKRLEDVFFIRDPNSVEELIDEMSRVQISTLKTLEVVWSTKYIAQIYVNYYYAYVQITTIDGTGWYNNFKHKPGVAYYRPLPIMYPQQFYSPKYKANQSTNEPDYRATVYWEPNINTDANGRARVSFYTSDLPKDYTVNIQGVTADGKMGSLIMKLPEAGKQSSQ